MATRPPVDTQLQARNRRTLIAGFSVAAGALALGFASVPLYRMFCEATGYGGTTGRASADAQVKVATGHQMSVRFNSTLANGLPWAFRPEQSTQTVTIGKRNMAIFIAKNLTDQPVTGQATFNVTPEESGKYFKKIECFCFTQQTLQPGQEVRMPVIYFVDPGIIGDEDNVDTQEITLSYTFYPVEKSKSAG